MDEENSCDSSSTTTSTRNYKELEECGGKWRQIFVTLAICYVCISGGNLVGFTSSAIPSIRGGGGNLPPFLRILENQIETHLGHLNQDSVGSGNNGTFEEVSFIIQEIDDVLDSIGRQDENIETKIVVGHPEFVELTDAQASWIGGLAPLGAFFGSLIAPLPIRILGPRGTILKLGAPSYVLSWFATSLAPGLVYIYAARLLGGLAMGCTFSAVPIYIMETASLELRGPLGTLSQFLFTVGVLMSFITGYCFDWRTSAFVSGLVVLPTFLFLPFVPESPIWLLSKKRSSDAENAFRKIRGFSMHSTEFQQLQSNSSVQSTAPVDLNLGFSRRHSFLRSPSKIRSTFVAIFLCIFQQLTGINAVNFYTVTIFEISAGQNSLLDGHSSAILVALVFCLANICSYFLIERLGRKVLLIVSTIFIALSAFSLGTYFYLMEHGDEDMKKSQLLAIVPLTSLVTFVLAFSIGYGPLLYVIVAEILPQNVRSVVTPVAVGVNWLCVFIVAKTFPGVIHVFRAYGVFWMYASFSCVSLLFTIFYLPETKGKTEDEIRAFFENSSGKGGNKDSESKEVDSLTTSLSLVV